MNIQNNINFEDILKITTLNIKLIKTIGDRAVYLFYSTESKYVVKIQRKEYDQYAPYYDQEVKIGQYMGHINVGPKVYTHWTIDGLTAKKDYGHIFNQYNKYIHWDESKFTSEFEYMFIVMEYVIGTTFGDILRSSSKNHYQNKIIKNLSLKILDKMHNHRYIHGDMSVDNIIVDRSLEPPIIKIIDYGRSIYIVDDILLDQKKKADIYSFELYVSYFK